MIGFGEAIGLFYKNYVNFNGRSTRAEYWWPTLMQVIIYLVLIVVFFFMFEAPEMESAEGVETGASFIILIGTLFFFVNLLPGISLKVRRFHDLDQTGWLVLVFWGANIFVPVVELARMIWFAFLGTNGPNKYGPDPHIIEADIFG